MIQAILGNTSGKVSGSTSPFAIPFGTQPILGFSEGVPFSAAGTIDRFLFKIDTVGTQTKILRIRNDTTATTVELTIPVGSTQIIDDTSTLSVSAGDKLRLQITNGGSGNPDMYCLWSFRFTGTNSNEAVCSGGARNLNVTDNGKHLFPVGTNEDDGTTVEAENYYIVPTSFTLKSFYASLSAASGSGGSSRTISIYKNGAQVAATALSFADADTDKSVTGLSVAFSAGDTMSIRHDGSGSLSGVRLTWGFLYNPTTDGESLVGGMTHQTLSSTIGTSEYQTLNGETDSVWSPSEDMSVQQVSHTQLLLRDFRVEIAASPGTDQYRRFHVRQNFSDTACVVTITGSSNSGVDPSNSSIVNDGDLINVRHEVLTSGVNASTHARWSSVMFIDPAGGAVSAAVTKYNTGTNGKIVACPVEGTGNIATLDFQSITDNRTYTYPNKSGTVAMNGGTLTATRVPFANSDGNLVDDADLTFVTDTLSATKVAMSSLTSGRVPIVSTAGLLVDDADMTFATDTLTVTKIAGAHNGTVGATTPASGVFTSLQADTITNDTGLAAGVYTPTRSAEANLDANVTMTEAQYLRVGNTVTVSGRFTADPTTTLTATSFEITLPVASNIGAAEDVAGVAFCGAIASQGAEIIGVAANDTAKVQWVATDATSQTWSYTFTYQVI